MRLSRILPILLVTTLTALGVSACQAPDNSAHDAAVKLADGLSSADLSAVSLSGGTPAQANTALTALLKPLNGIRPAVAVGDVKVSSDSKDSATAQLNVTWDLAGVPWTYPTTAALSRSNGVWSTPWSLQLLLPGFKDGDVLALTTRQAPRGQILGDGGQAIVQDRPVVHVGIDKTRVDAAAQDASARALAALAQLDPDAYAKQVAASGPQAFVEAVTLRDDAARTPNDAQIAAVTGAVAIKDTLPLAPSRDFARPILGSVGEPSAEQIQKSGGKLKQGELTGLAGLQAQYNDLLSGTNGVVLVEKDPAAPAGQAPRTLFTTDPKTGGNLKTTLNINMQTLAESLLQSTTSPSAIVALRPSTGAIVAAASGPASKGYNTAFLGQYAPGSTFKTATSLGLLRKGLTPDSTVACTASVTAGGTVFKNAPEYSASNEGQIPLRLAFAHSCNTAFVASAGTLSQNDITAAAASLGIGVAQDIGTDSFDGSVPTTVTDAEHAASMIGQGKVLVSPLGMANVAATVSHGSLVAPWLVDKSTPKPGQAAAASGTSSSSAGPSTSSSATPSGAAASASSSSSATAQQSPPAPLTAAEAASLKDLMGAVVNDGGAPFLKNLPGGAVIAKTGTAEYGNEVPPKTHAWLIAAQGDLAVAVFVEDGGYGALTSGPILTKFLNGVAAQG
ncbi:penicillin-binding transpeptidase domain-containing protein [Psychromicrobium xiongbiense]|uniref:penicillin-binding transpeptidase domain-containing protein n=1 Tax=Psychromicrobium xiongbiense TaxID=3051184 RepID=UPI00255212A3|nr:penicillin-binding transpeptidase domain-containing protein [Psychromicrobium sp. YIM S02556]